MQRLPGEIGIFTAGESRTALPLTVLTIAGFDPSSGAGFTADLKVFAAFGLYGLACPTALTVQSTQGVRRSESCSAALVRDTLACLSDDFKIAGVKLGMLATAEMVEAVARWLGEFLGLHPATPVVLDPVLRSSSGAILLDEPGVRALGRELLPLATVVTPNHDEAAILAGLPPDASAQARGQVEAMARAILSRMARQTAHAGSVVITGGHAGADETPDDFLLGPPTTEGSSEGTWFQGEWVRTRSTHGTGCAFSSALLCGLVRGLSMEEATAGAKAYVRAALAAAYPLGKGKGPLHHLFRLEDAR